MGRFAQRNSSINVSHMNAKMNASAPTDPTSAWPMWIQVVIRSWIGAMLGSAVRKNMRAS